MGRARWGRSLRTGVLLWVGLALAIAGCGGDGGNGGRDAGGDGGDAKVLRVGFAADFGELGGFADRPAAAALAHLERKINAEGGIDGARIDVIVKPTSDGKPETVQRAVRELIDAGVSAILGPPFTDLGLPILTETGGRVPVVFIASTDPALGNVDQNSFLVAFSDYDQASAAAEYALAEGMRRAVTLSSPDAPYFTQTTKSFAKRMRAGGGEVVRDLTFSLADEDFSSQVNQIANLSPAPDVLYTAMVMPAVGTLLGQLRAAGLQDLRVIGADSFDATDVAAAGSDAEGVVYTAHTFAGPGSKAQEFLDGYRQDTGKTLETISFGTLAADALNLVIEAYRAAGTTDPDEISAALRDIQGFEGLTGSITFRGTKGIPRKDVFLVTIRGGKPELVERVVPEDVAVP